MVHFIHKELSESIIGAAIEVHKTVGPGLLELFYEECMCIELRMRGHQYERQVEFPLRYKGDTLPGRYRMDLLVDDVVVLEIKTVERILPVHEAQLLTYLRVSEKPLGFILNFKVATMKDGIRRLALSPRPAS